MGQREVGGGGEWLALGLRALEELRLVVNRAIDERVCDVLEQMREAGEEWEAIGRSLPTPVSAQAAGQWFRRLRDRLGRT